MKKLLLPLILFFLIISSQATLGASPSFSNFSATKEITSFLENILVRMQSVVAFLAVLFIVLGGLLYVLAGTTGNDKLAQTAKACWTGSLVGLALGVAGPAFLKQIKAIFLKNGTMPSTLEGALSLQEIVINMLNFLLSIFGTLAIISLTVCGIMYIFSFGDQKKVVEAIKNSLLGVIIAGSSLIVVNQIITLITK